MKYYDYPLILHVILSTYLKITCNIGRIKTKYSQHKIIWMLRYSLLFPPQSDFLVAVADF